MVDLNSDDTGLVSQIFKVGIMKKNKPPFVKKRFLRKISPEKLRC